MIKNAGWALLESASSFHGLLVLVSSLHYSFSLCLPEEIGQHFNTNLLRILPKNTPKKQWPQEPDELLKIQVGGTGFEH